MTTLEAVLHPVRAWGGGAAWGGDAALALGTP